MELIPFAKYEDFLNENYQSAKKFLAEKEIPITDPKFQHLVKLLQKKQGWLFMFTKFYFEDEVPMHTLDTLYNRLNHLQLKGLLQQIEKPVDRYEKAEELSDALDKLDRIAKIRDFYRKFTGTLKNAYNNAAPEQQEEVGELAIAYHELAKPLQAEFVRKISRYHSIEEFIKGLNDFIVEVSEGFSYELIKEKAAKYEGAHLLYANEQDGILLYNITDYAASKAIGSTQWCISYDSHYWGTYVGNSDVFTKQYFIYNFNLSIVNPLCMIGTTIDRDGSYYRYSIMKKDDVAINEKEFDDYCAKYDIPMSLLAPMSKEEADKKEATAWFSSKVKSAKRNDEWAWIFDTFEQVNDPFIEKRVYLLAAVKEKNIDFIKKLLQNGYTLETTLIDNDGYDTELAVLDAAIKFHFGEEEDFVEQLIELGYKPNPESSWYLGYIMDRKQTERIKSFLQSLSIEEINDLGMLRKGMSYAISYIPQLLHTGPFEIFTWLYDTKKPTADDMALWFKTTLDDLTSQDTITKEICEFVMDKYPQPTGELVLGIFRNFISYDYAYYDALDYVTKHKAIMVKNREGELIHTLFQDKALKDTHKNYDLMVHAVYSLIEWGCYDTAEAQATLLCIKMDDPETAVTVATRSKEHGVILKLTPMLNSAIDDMDYKNVKFIVEDLNVQVNGGNLQTWYSTRHKGEDGAPYKILCLLLKRGKLVIDENTSYSGGYYSGSYDLATSSKKNLVSAVFDVLSKKDDIEMTEFVINECKLDNQYIDNSAFTYIINVFTKHKKLDELIWLLENDTIDPSVISASVLTAFVYRKDLENLKRFAKFKWEKVDNVLGNSIVNAAIKVDSIAILEYLFDDYGIDMNSDALRFENVLSEKKIDIARWLFEERGYRVSPHSYCFSISMTHYDVSLEMIELFGEYNPELVERGKNDALFNACEYGNADMVNYCLDHGANVNYQKGDYQHLNKKTSPLEKCCLSDRSNMDTFITLIQRGAEVTKKAVENIVGKNHPVFLKYLLDKNLIQKDDEWFAIADGSEMFTYLMTLNMDINGAVPTATDNWQRRGMNRITAALYTAAKQGIECLTNFSTQYKDEIDKNLEDYIFVSRICKASMPRDISKDAFDYAYNHYASIGAIYDVYDEEKRSNSLSDHARIRLKLSIDKDKAADKAAAKAEKDAAKAAAKAEKDAATKAAKEAAAAAKAAAKAKPKNESYVIRFNDFM